MDSFREFLRDSFGITSHIDDNVLRDLREYWFPSIPSGKFPAIIIARNSVLAWLRNSSSQVNQSTAINQIIPINPYTPDLSGSQNTIAASLFDGKPATIASYARMYYETGELTIPDNFGDELANFLTDRQDVNGEVVDYISPYVRAVVPHLPGARDGLMGNPPVITKEYLLGAIVQGSSENVYEVLKELDIDMSLFWFVAFSTTSMVRDLLRRFEGSDYLPLLLETLAYLPLKTFVDCLEDIVRVSDGANYTAGRAYSLGDITRLWCLRSTTNELNPEVNSDFSYFSGTFKQTQLIYDYYVATRR